MGNNARTFGQDLMRGEHTVGVGMSKKRLSPGGGGGGGGCWRGGKETASTHKFTTGLAGGLMQHRDDLAAGIASDYQGQEATGTSIFDPVLCEVAYRWFCPKGGTVLDPFAGGSVRGIVASVLGLQYHGMELRAEQVAANREQLGIARMPKPVWHVGDSRGISALGVDADFIFSCPPYFDLEVYSDDPLDLSTMDYGEFLEAYRQIIGASCGLLRDNRFACFVVGDVRDKKGSYRNFVGDTVESFRAAGLEFYNDAVLITAVGSLPVRAGRQFAASRKLGKTHQNVLVFVKGDGKKAAQQCNL